MTTVFIAGSISIRHLHTKVLERIQRIVGSNFSVLIGDAHGVDALVQDYLRGSEAQKVTVYCSGDTPRNNLGDWPVQRVYTKARPGSRAFYTPKDIQMARDSDYGLMIWDGKSTGTLCNIFELLRRKKKTLVFISTDQSFVTVSDVSGLERLLAQMPEEARSKAEGKIRLGKKIQALEQGQLTLSLSGES